VGRDRASAGGHDGLTVALLNTLLHTAPVGLGFVDTDLCFVRVNEMLAAMDGVAVEDHLGRTVADVLPNLADTIVPILRRTLETAEPSVDTEVTDGNRQWVLSYYPVQDEGEDDEAPVGVGVVVRDVTDERRATSDLDARARHLGAVARLGQQALIIDDFEGVLREGVELLAQILGTDYVYVLEHVRDEGAFVLRFTYGFDEQLGRRIDDDETMQPGYALYNRMPVTVPDVDTEERFGINPLVKSLGAQSSMTVVIRGPGWPYGVVGTASLKRREFRPEEVDFVQSMANVLGTAAARHRVDTALRSERERLRLALDAGGMGDWEWDIATNSVSWSESLHEIFGMEPGQFGGSFDDYLAVVHPEDRQRVLDTVAAAMEGDQFTMEHRANMPDGTFRWISSSGRVIRDEQGTPVSMIGVANDITARMEAEYKQTILFAGEQEARAEAERARDRLEFLAEASEVLASSLDYRATLSQVARLAVSRLADWCAVDIREEEPGTPPSVVVVHVDPAKVALAEEFREKYPPDPNSDTGVDAVIRTGEPVMFSEITDEMLVAAAVDDEHLAMLRELALGSAMVVPLVARGNTFGAITMIAGESGRRYDDDDLALAMDLAQRAAVAIDNARLYRERTQVAEALQRSLLPLRSPEIPGLEVGVRYRPVGRGTEIGGDFYDVFEAREGSWVVVIGDVCGKGTEAAAITGLARDTIRGLSIRERSPQRVLRVLNEVMRRRDDDSRFLTVAMSRLEVADDGAGAHLQVACAGHPLPLVVRADGTIEEAGQVALLLGLFPEIAPADVPVSLAPGDAIVLYTDGVVEAHGADGLFGEERLRALLAELGSVEAEDLAQAIVDAVAEFQPGSPQDDVAVVVVRVPAQSLAV
jgi:PAS domain S-box-containing protein